MGKNKAKESRVIITDIPILTKREYSVFELLKKEQSITPQRASPHSLISDILKAENP